MSEKPVIFLSHSSKDSERVNILKQQIETVLDNVRVFETSDSEAIQISNEWLKDILFNLETSHALIVVVSSTSKISTWVNFEIGYFWKRNEDRRGQGVKELPIYPLCLNNEPAFGILQTIQSKSLDKPKDFKSFLSTLCSYFNKDVDQINFEDVFALYKPESSLIIGKHNLWDRKPPKNEPRS